MPRHFLTSGRQNTHPLSSFQQFLEVEQLNEKLVQQHNARVRFPHLNHHRWSSRSRGWPSERLHVSFPTSQFHHRAQDSMASTVSNRTAQSISNSRSPSSWGGPMIRESQKNLLSTSNFAAVRHHPTMSVHFADPRFPIVKDDRQLFTLKPITATETAPPTFDAPIVPASKSPSPTRTSGPIRAQHRSTQARMQAGPMHPAPKARILGNASKKTSEVDKAPVNPTPISPIETEPTDQLERVRYIRSALQSSPPGN